MATRGYPPQPHHYQHQPPPQRQHQYDQRTGPRWQEPPQQQRMPPPRQQQPPPQQYNGYQDQYSYHGGYGGYDSGYDQQSYYPDQYQNQNYQDPYQYNDQYYQDPRGQPPPERQYHYDERYHQQNQGRQTPADGRGYDTQQHPRDPKDRQRPPQLEQKKQKPRERILTDEPESPKVLAWDNPFGAFPAKKEKEEKKEKKDDKNAKGEQHQLRESSDSKQQRSGGWDTRDRRGDQQEPRPNTSHGQQRYRDEPQRPNTSHDQRAPGPPEQAPNFERDDMLWKRRQLDAVGPSTTVAPLRPQVPPATSLPSRPVPQRSVTQPNQSNTGPVAVNGYDYNRPTNDKHAMVGVRPPVRQASDNQYDRDPSYAPVSRSQTYDQQQGTTEMPNFDAMAPNVAETLTGPKTVETPAYAKKSYHTLAVDTQPPPPPPVPAESHESPLAQFTFDLPHSNSAPPAMDRLARSPEKQMISPAGHEQQPSATGRFESAAKNRGPGGSAGPGPRAAAPFDYNNPPLSPPVPAQNNRNYDPRIAPRGASRDQTHNPASQYPPRGASRPDPVTTRDPSDQYSQQDSGYWTMSPDQKQMQPNQTVKRGGPGYGRGGPEQYDRGYGYDPSLGNPYDPDPYTQQDGYDPVQHGQGYDRKSPPQQGYPPGNYAQGMSQRSAASNASHPAPLRSYGGRASADGSRPEVPPPTGGGYDRPPPIRPGLMNSQPPPQPRGSSGSPMQQGPARPQQQNMPQSNLQARRTSATSEENKPTVTVAELNSMREQFKEHPNDFALGLRFAKRLVEAAKVLSNENGRADPKQVARNRERYIDDAHKVVKKMVNAGSTDAMFYLADCYGQGSLGLPVDAKEAFHLYQSAAKMNHPQSAYRVAVCCELGNEEGGGTRRDPMKAIQWYKRAATLGDTPAMYKMGMIQLKGLLGQQRDPRQAVSWLKRAAERADKDNPHALHELGLLYESAKPEDHILRDERYAFDLFSQAAELGYKYSQFRLGSAFEYGALGCPIDQRQSIAWYSKAAGQGEHQSELALSGWYLTGAGDLVKQNDQEAFLWARKAASSGLAKAEFAMGYYCEMGIGTRADLEEAKRWYYRAAAQGFPKARERLEELKMGTKGKKKEIRRSNAREGDCIVM